MNIANTNSIHEATSDKGRKVEINLFDSGVR